MFRFTRMVKCCTSPTSKRSLKFSENVHYIHGYFIKCNLFKLWKTVCSFSGNERPYKTVTYLTYLVHHYIFSDSYCLTWSRDAIVFVRGRGDTLGSFSKARRLRWGKCHQTKGLISKTIAVHARFESWHIFLPCSAKRQREITTIFVFRRTRTAVANLCYLLF